MTDVKRRYDGAARRARAEQVRLLLLNTAHEQLVAGGYAALTIPKLASLCGVSPESVYKRFPGKPALVRAVVEHALRGVGPVAAETRSDALDSDDLETLVRGWSDLSAEVAPRVAPILLVVQAGAAHDPELAKLAQELDDNRRSRMRDNARRLAGAGHLPPGMSTDRATDVLWTHSAPEIYGLLVIRSGWNLQQYSAFLAAGIVAQFGAKTTEGPGGSPGPSARTDDQTS